MIILRVQRFCYPSSSLVGFLINPLITPQAWHYGHSCHTEPVVLTGQCDRYSAVDAARVPGQFSFYRFPVWPLCPRQIPVYRALVLSILLLTHQACLSPLLFTCHSFWDLPILPVKSLYSTCSLHWPLIDFLLCPELHKPLTLWMAVARCRHAAYSHGYMGTSTQVHVIHFPWVDRLFQTTFSKTCTTY